MPAAYVIRRSTNAQFYFFLTSENNEPILTSETYRDKSGAHTGINSVRVNSPLDQRYERLTAKDGSYYFVLKSGNYEIIGTSEMYSSIQARDIGIASVKRNGPKAPVRDET